MKTFLGLECKSSQGGKEFGATLNVTISGKPCQKWTDITPHPHEWTHLLRREQNYCRNPDTDGRKLGPWCFTTDPNTEWEYCNVSFCVGKAVSDRCSLFNGDSSCGPNMNCLPGWYDHCQCSEHSVMEPENKTCLAIGRYMDPCSLTASNISCYPPLLCSGSECFCEVPALQSYDQVNNTCTSIELDDVEQFVNMTNVFGHIVGATMESFNHTNLNKEEKEHIVHDIVSVLTILPTENEAELESVIEAATEISKQETEVLSDTTQDALLDVLDKASEKLAHTDVVNKNETAKVQHMVLSLFDSSANLLDAQVVTEPDKDTDKQPPNNDQTDNGNVDTGKDDSGNNDSGNNDSENNDSENNDSGNNDSGSDDSGNEYPESDYIAEYDDVVQEERTKKILHTLDMIAETALQTLDKEEPKNIEFSSKSMNLLVGISKFNTSSNASTNIQTSRKIGNTTVTSSFELPTEIQEQLKQVSNTGFKFQMLFSDRNPRIYDKTSRFINTPMISLTLRDINQGELHVQELPMPVIIKIPTGKHAKYQRYTINATDEDVTDESNFLRLKVSQRANQYYMMKLITDGPQYNVSIRIAIDFQKKVSIYDTINGMVLLDSRTAFLKDPKPTTVTWSVGIFAIYSGGNKTNTTAPEISVNISTTAINCRYWNNTVGKWLADGCKVSPLSSGESLECGCDHLTDFAGGIFVIPNFIDPIADILLFLTFFDNPVIVCTVILIWMVYFVGLYWARQADRRDSAVVLIFTHLCILCTKKGNKQKQDRVHLQGDKRQSSRHCLSKSSSGQVLFQTGAEDWFLMTSSFDLGVLENVVIWHDNSGSSPSWFLSRIIIEDIQMKKIYNFYCENWLGVESESTKFRLTNTSTEELKTNLRHQFILKTGQELRRGHLWLSILSKPPNSDFTRVQRLSCALSLLLCTMLTCLMFHGIPTEDSVKSEVVGFQFSISLKDIVIGIESSIFMFPINFIIIELFMRTKPRTSKSDRYTAVQRDGSCSNSGNDNLLENTKTETIAVNRNMLPWWVIYIAWTTVSLTSLTTSFFVMLYGLKYGYYESLEWLVSFITAFVDDVVILEPLTIVIFAVIITFILKRPVRIGDAPPQIVQGSEDSIDDQYASQRTQKQNSIPDHVPKKYLQQRKQESELTATLQTKTQDIILFLIFITVMLLVVHNHRPVEQCFQQSQTVNNMFIKKKFDFVKTHSDMWNFINKSVVMSLNRTLPFDKSKKNPENDFLLLGTLRLRQIRVEKSSCEFPDIIKNVYTLECTSPLGYINDDTASYNKSWQTQIHTSHDEWAYHSAWDLTSVPYIGTRAVYGGGGYVVEMKPNPSADSKISELISKLWIDERTRALFVEFTLYNPNLNLYSSVTIVFEFSSPGGITTSFLTFTTPLSDYSSDKEIIKLLFEIIFFLFTFFLSYIEVKRIRQMGFKLYVKGFWNQVSMFVVILCIIGISIFIERYIIISQIMHQYREGHGKTFVNFNLAILWDNIFIYIMALLTVFAFLKFVKLLMMNRKLHYLYSMVEYAQVPLKYFAFMFTISLIAFASFGNLLLGSVMSGYKSFGDSFMTLVECTCKINNYSQYIDLQPVIGPIFILLYIFVFFFCFMKMFTAIVLNAMKILKKKGVKHDEDTALLLNYFIDNVKRMLR
ncbi:PKD1L2 [Mytilus edulis]|uniref:PKD1L2 n=1 Tax=Mytilus edulis TaxID=6550 RepID=A0A8S3SIV7_MYTED|nr:PKD1L2 [Mytilus edulis]